MAKSGLPKCDDGPRRWRGHPQPPPGGTGRFALLPRAFSDVSAVLVGHSEVSTICTAYLSSVGEPQVMWSRAAWLFIRPRPRHQRLPALFDSWRRAGPTGLRAAHASPGTPWSGGEERRGPWPLQLLDETGDCDWCQARTWSTCPSVVARVRLGVSLVSGLILCRGGEKTISSSTVVWISNSWEIWSTVGSSCASACIG